MARQRGSICAFLERADVGAQLLRQHRHDPVGEVDAVAPRARFAVQFGAGADVVADVGDGDDRVPAAVLARARPDGIVVVARVDRVDRDDRQVGQVLALAEWLVRDPLGFFDRLGAEGVGQAVLVDGDEAEAARRKGVAEDRVDPGGDPWRAPGRLGEDEVADLRVLEVADHELAPLALVDRRQEVARALLTNDAEDEVGGFLEPLHRVGDQAVARFLGAGENAIVERQR